MDKLKEPEGSDRLAESYARKHRIRVKTEKEIEAIRRAGRLVVATLDLVAPRIAPGITTDQINTWVHAFTAENGAVPAPLNYRGYPKSVCVSVNEVICHGIPDSRPLQDGDICNIDVTGWIGGVHGDTNATFFVGDVDPESRQLVRSSGRPARFARVPIRERSVQAAISQTPDRSFRRANSRAWNGTAAPAFFRAWIAKYSSMAPVSR